MCGHRGSCFRQYWRAFVAVDDDDGGRGHQGPTLFRTAMGGTLSTSILAQTLVGMLDETRLRRSRRSEAVGVLYQKLGSSRRPALLKGSQGDSTDFTLSPNPSARTCSFRPPSR